MTEYLVIYEQGDDGWGAYSPDLPGVVSHGDTQEGAAEGMREAVELFLEDVRRSGGSPPAPRSTAGVVAA